MEFQSFGLKSYTDYFDKNNISVSSIHMYLRNLLLENHCEFLRMHPLETWEFLTTSLNFRIATETAQATDTKDESERRLKQRGSVFNSETNA